MRSRRLQLILIVSALLLLLCTNCALYKNETDSTIVFDANPEPKPLAKQPLPSPLVSNQALARNPWIVSIHVLEYLGNKFRCPGLVVNESRIVASKYCNISEDMAIRTRIRSQSIYYNKGGQEHRCIQLTQHYQTNVIFLDIEPPFPHKIVPNPKPVISYGLLSWTYATDVSWLHFPKDKPFRELIWTQHDKALPWNKSVCAQYSRISYLKFMMVKCNYVISTRKSDKDMCEKFKVYILEKIPVGFSLPKCD